MSKPPYMKSGPLFPSLTFHFLFVAVRRFPRLPRPEVSSFNSYVFQTDMPSESVDRIGLFPSPFPLLLPLSFFLSPCRGSFLMSWCERLPSWSQQFCRSFFPLPTVPFYFPPNRVPPSFCVFPPYGPAAHCLLALLVVLVFSSFFFSRDRDSYRATFRDSAILPPSQVPTSILSPFPSAFVPFPFPPVLGFPFFCLLSDLPSAAIPPNHSVSYFFPIK